MHHILKLGKLRIECPHERTPRYSKSFPFGHVIGAKENNHIAI